MPALEKPRLGLLVSSLRKRRVQMRKLIIIAFWIEREKFLNLLPGEGNRAKYV